MTQNQTLARPHTSLLASVPTNRALRGVVAEWNAVSNNHRALRRANAWGLPGEPVDNLDEMVMRAGFGGPKTCDDADAYLLELVKRAASDPLAAQVVLQRILPPLLAIARRRGRQVAGGTDAAISDLLTQAWFVIASYPAERRPKKVAANIVRDIEYFEYVAENRPRKASVLFIDHGHFTIGETALALLGSQAGPDDEVRHFLLELERRGLSPIRLEILRLSCEGWRSAEIAEKLGMKERTARWHRSAAFAAAREVLKGEVRPDVKSDDCAPSDSAA